MHTLQIATYPQSWASAELLGVRLLQHRAKVFAHCPYKYTQPNH